MEALSIAYQLMSECTIPVAGYEISLWDAFMFFLLANLVIWMIKKIFF